MAANNWYNSALSTNTSEYWKFPATNGQTYLVAWNERGSSGDGTKTADIKVSAYWESDNSSIFSATDSGWTSPKSVIATRTDNIVIKVETYSSSATYAGTYAIAITDWYTSGASITSGWYNSSLTTNGSETRVIPVTAGKRYIVAWNDTSYGDGTKTARVYASAYWQDDESSIVSRTTNGWSSPKIFYCDKDRQCGCQS